MDYGQLDMMWTHSTSCINTALLHRSIRCTIHTRSYKKSGTCICILSIRYGVEKLAYFTNTIMTATATLMSLQPLLLPPQPQPLPPPPMSTLCSQSSPTEIKKQNPSTIWEIISHFIKTVILGIINTTIITINTSRNEDSLENFLALTHSWHAEDCNQAYTSWDQQISCLYLATLNTLGEEKKQYS